MWKCILILEDISIGSANFSAIPHKLNIYGGNIDVSFVLSSKGTPVCNSSSSVLVPNRKQTFSNPRAMLNKTKETSFA